MLIATLSIAVPLLVFATIIEKLVPSDTLKKISNTLKYDGARKWNQAFWTLFEAIFSKNHMTKI